MQTMDKIRFWAMLPRYLSIQSSPPSPPLMDKHPSLFWRKNKYRRYSSERLGASFNFGFLKWRCLFEGGAHWIYQKDIKILSTCLFNQTIRTVIITGEQNVLRLKWCANSTIYKKNSAASWIRCIIEFFT